MIDDAPIILTGKQTRSFITLTEKQPKRFLSDGGARCGKTFFLVASLLTLADKYPKNFKALVCRKTLKAAKSTVFKESILPFIRNMPGWSFRGANASPEVIGPKGQIILIGGLDNPDNFMGDEYGVIWINEATQATYDDYSQLMTRLNRSCRADNNSTRMNNACWLDCNPSHRRHWIHKLCIEGMDPETHEKKGAWPRQHWIPQDNPYLAPDYVETLSALPEIKRKRMLNGIWCDSEGTVYNEFSEDIHTWDWGDQPNNWTNLPSIEGIDFGYNDPFVWLQAKIHDQELWFHPPLIYQSSCIVEDHARNILNSRSQSPLWCVADHDKEDRATLERHGVNTTPAYKSIAEGINQVAQSLRPDSRGRPLIRIHHEMEDVINEFFSYTWAKPNANRNHGELPRDLNNHAMDTIRYMVMKHHGIHKPNKKPAPIRWHSRIKKS